MIRKLRSIIEAMSIWLSIAFLASIVSIIAMQIIARRVGIALGWTEELTRYLFVWISFLGIIIAMRNGTHISVTFVVDAVPKRFKPFFTILGWLAALVFAGIMMFYGTRLVMNNFDVGTVALFFNFWVVYLIVPITGFYILLSTLASVVESFFSNAGVEDSRS